MIGRLLAAGILTAGVASGADIRVPPMKQRAVKHAASLAQEWTQEATCGAWLHSTAPTDHQAAWEAMVVFWAPEKACGGAYARAEPGAPVVFVCPAFEQLYARSPQKAAAVLLHESLHVAGLEEWPTPGAMKSQAITQAVEKACWR